MKSSLPLISFFTALILILIFPQRGTSQVTDPIFQEEEHRHRRCHHAPNPITLRPLTLAEQNARTASVGRSDTFDLIHTNITLEVIDFTGQHIQGFCEISFSPKVEDVTVLPLDLLALQVDSIFVDNLTATYNYDDLLLEVDLPQAYPVGDTASVRVYYGGTPTFDPSDFGGFVFTSNLAYNLGIGLSSNPYNFGRSWFPCFDNFVERTTYEFHIYSANGRKAYCVGTFLGETPVTGDTILRSYHMSQPIPTYLVGVAVSNYTESNSIHTGAYGDIPVQLVAWPGDINAVENTFVDLPEAIDALESWFGPYMFERVGYVMTPVGAMEHPTNIAYPQSIGAGGNGNGHRDLMSHELAHCWWGNVVTLSTPADMWFKEGNAEYGSYLVVEYLEGHDEFIREVKSNFRKVIRSAHFEDGDYLPLSGIPYEHTYSTHTYDKGAAMMHNLRAYLGDELFSSGMTAVLNHFIYQSIDAAQFRDYLSDETGVDLTSFFDDWIYAPGYSGYEINWMDITPNVNSAVEIEQKLRAAPHFHTNVPIEITFLAADGTRHMEEVMVSGQLSEVQVNVPFDPVAAWLNGNHKLNIANLADEFVYTEPDNHVFPNGELDVVVDEMSDDVFLRVEHAWIPPDVPQNAPPGSRISNSHYWKIDGLLPEQFDGNARFTYRANTTPMLDADLTSETEDSIVLVYRRDATEEWRLFEPSTKLILAPNDGWGFLRADSLLLGEYAFGVGEFPPLVSSHEPMPLPSLDIYPNPGKGLFHLSGTLDENRSLICKVFNTSGSLLRTVPLGDFTAGIWSTQIDLQRLTNGAYLLQIEDKQQRLRSTRKITIQR